MISRVADHCFWFGRYLERAESTARVLFVTRNLALDAELLPAQCWTPVIVVSGEEDTFVERFGADAQSDGERVQDYMTWDDSNWSSILRSVGAARENARSIREVVSLETWEAINELYLYVSSDRARVDYRDQRYGFYRQIRQSVQLCLGLVRGTMLHDTPLDFIWLGVLLERSGQTARILDVHHHALAGGPVALGAVHPISGGDSGPIAGAAHDVVETALWLSLLRACSGFEPFMKLSFGKVTGAAVAAFLVLEPRFPRSVRFCVRSAYERLCAIRPAAEAELPGGRSLERLRVLDVWMERRARDPLDPSSVHEFLTHVVDETAAICVLIGEELLGQEPAAPEPALPVAAVTGVAAVAAVGDVAAVALPTAAQ